MIAAAALIAIGIAAAVGGRQAQTSVSSIPSLSTYDAAPGGYRAWYELLAREGEPVQRFERRPAFLDPSVDVYVTAYEVSNAIAQAAAGSAPDIFVEADWYALAKWVRAGGHLVWLTAGTLPSEYLNAPLVSDSGMKADSAVPVALSPLSTGVRSVSGTSGQRIRFSTAVRSAPLIADDTGSVVVTYPLGKGVVTVIADESLFTNGRLARADNARLAYDVATAGLTPHGSIAFDEWSHGYVSGDSWWTVLPRPIQIALIAIACVFVAVLVGSALRFGPLAQLPDGAERTSAEYLTSMAVLYQRGRAVRAPLVEMADGCLRDVARALGLPENAGARAIAARLGGPDEGLAEAVMDLDRLRSYEAPHESDLVRAAALCVSLRKEFSSHGIGIGRRVAPQRRTA